MRRLQNEHMTDEEKKLKSFSRKNLQKLSNWEEWRKADHTQLDAHFDSGTIGKAIPRPVEDPRKPSQVFRVVWARLVKANGRRKSRACLDGSKRAAPWLRQMVQTYASCIELPCLRLFFALCAQRGYYVGFGDVDNAYQQSPPPSVDCYLRVDDEIFDWYLHRFGTRLDRFKDVLPILKALQGHPEAGVLWERMITDILVNKMGFKHPTHERNLYFGYLDGHEILVCRQVDDFASGSPTKAGCEAFITALRSFVEAEYNYMGMETSKGMFERYNGIDVIQTRDYIKLSCESYIDRVLETHGWTTPGRPDPEKIVPIHTDKVEKLMALEGPREKTPEAKALVAKYGFSYRNLLGELVYAYVICRTDIGFAVCFLARFSLAPHEEHYNALRHVCKYLRALKEWGIYYHRPTPLPDLPGVPFVFLEPEADLPPFPYMDFDELLALVDAAHGTDRVKRRSVTGLDVLFCRAAIAWKSKLQSLTATSSTEAEFYGTVAAGKMVLYFRHVLQELGFLREGPSVIYVDNQATVDVVMENRPTPRLRHVEVQHFAIQRWREEGWLAVHHLAGTLQCADGLTKALGWVLHYRHARRSMGHYRPTERSSEWLRDSVT